jgi:hypothetical protein
MLLTVTQYKDFYKKKYKKTITRSGIIHLITHGNLNAVKYGYCYLIDTETEIKKFKRGRPFKQALEIKSKRIKK